MHMYRYVHQRHKQLEYSSKRERERERESGADARKMIELQRWVKRISEIRLHPVLGFFLSCSSCRSLLCCNKRSSFFSSSDVPSVYDSRVADSCSRRCVNTGHLEDEKPLKVCRSSSSSSWQSLSV